MIDDLITLHKPPESRARQCDGDKERHLTEGAVMVAFAMHLLRTVPGIRHVEIHPDGEHGKRFDLRGWLKRHGFTMATPTGITTYGGTYRSETGQTILVDPKSGHGDVVAHSDAYCIIAECKGGVINSRHAGQLLRLRKGLCEAIGLSLASEIAPGKRQFAVVPKTSATEKLAKRMIGRAKAAGVEIALVDETGNAFEVA
jgi:hypothetical protein